MSTDTEIQCGIRLSAQHAAIVAAYFDGIIGEEEIDQWISAIYLRQDQVAAVKAKIREAEKH